MGETQLEVLDFPIFGTLQCFETCGEGLQLIPVILHLPPQLLIFRGEEVESLESLLIVDLVDLVLMIPLPGIALKYLYFSLDRGKGYLEALGELLEFVIIVPEGLLATHLLSQLLNLHLVGVPVEIVALYLPESAWGRGYFSRY